MRLGALWCLVAGLAIIAGCSRQETVSCNTDLRYAVARSAPPVQIPDDLSPPNESDALRLPPDAGGSSSSTAGPCLQSPPSFFSEGRPFQVGDGSDDELSRRERREARRQEDGEAPADRPATAPAEPIDAPSDQDRVIEN
jgi:hypothetical protein